jgi:response regulator RpfG family c-di-GMP phosphodiesterase
VLVVDDAPTNVALLKQLLSRDGHTVLTSADGLDALAIVERERPELVLTDVVMPGQDGHELCRAIKANPATSLLRLKRSTDELDSAEAVIMSLARTVEARDPCTEGHCQRLSRLGSALGTRIGLGAEDISALALPQIIGVVDVYDALTTERPYKRAMDAPRAFEALFEEAARDGATSSWSRSSS